MHIRQGAQCVYTKRVQEGLEIEKSRTEKSRVFSEMSRIFKRLVKECDITSSIFSIKYKKVKVFYQSLLGMTLFCILIPHSGLKFEFYRKFYKKKQSLAILTYFPQASSNSKFARVWTQLSLRYGSRLHRHRQEMGAKLARILWLHSSKITDG